VIPPDGESLSVGEPSSGPGSQTDTSRDADVHAFLIADVRGYTAFTQERGDEDAARLAGRFAQVTRSVVEDHRGHVLEFRGDEALVVFGSPRSAIRGAVALQQRFVEETVADPSLPLTVGIGLDAGEAVAVEGGYRGGALNVAARLCSLARAGEVLASREIVHLALRVDGVRFTERGQAALKGLDKPVHVVAVRSEARDDALAIAPFVRSIAPPPRPRWKAVAAVVAFALVAALVAIPLVARRAGGNSEIEPNSVGVLDPESGEVTATVELEDPPGSIASSADAVWVTNPDVGTVTQIDPEEQEVRDRIQVGEDPTGIAVGFDAVWVVNSGGPSVSRISPETNQVVETIPVGNGPAGIAVGEGAVWVTNRFDGTVSRIDPDTNEVIKEIPVGLDPQGIATGFDSVWVALAGSNQVVRIDPTTNEVTAPISVGNAPGSLAVSPDAVWVANALDDTVSEIDPDTNTVVGTAVVGDGPSSVAVVQGSVWVANEWDGTLSRIEHDQASASPIVIGSVPQGIAGANGDLWVSVRGTATSHRGGTLRVVAGAPPFSLDPRSSYDYVAWEVLHLIGDGLVAFEPTGGGSRLVPDLATVIPTPTEGGLTYTFQLRHGIQYSNGEVVEPADFLSAFERGWLLDPGDHQDLYGRLVGAKACAKDPPTCDLSEGIVTDDASGTITFHLRRPDPEFVYKLTIPFAYPVPPSVPDEEQAAAGVPGTGPYMLEAPMTGEGLTLVRNPNFRIWSPAARPDGYVDRIEWAFGVKPKAQIEAVKAGGADLASYPVGAPQQLEDLFVRFPAQVHTSPEANTFFAVLDTRIPPFDDVDVRQAMNFAIDRGRIVQIFGGEDAARATCQQLPPNFPGYSPYCPYTLDPGPGGEGSWTEPDMEEAQRLVRRSGTAGSRVVVKIPTFFPKLSEAQARLLEDYMIELLDDLGYVGSVELVAHPDHFYTPELEFDMVVDGWASDYPAASNFITNRFTCDSSWIPSARFCDPQIDALIERATQMQIDDPAAAGAPWAEVDRAIVDQAPHVWLVNSIAVEFVSERVGNYQYSQQWATLLDQMWVR
jgi:peptide/nickel transport system substrate-binding protein